MTEVNPVAAPVAASAGDMDERAAEVMLARLADARLMAATRPAGRAAALMAAAVLTAAGAWLRTLMVPDWLVVASACAVVAGVACAGPGLARRGGRREPRWVQAAQVHQASLAGRVPAGTLEAVDRSVAGLAGRWRSVHLYVSRCTETGPHFAVCQTAAVYPAGGRLLVIVGEHLATGPSQLAAAVLGHEAGHPAGWRLRVSYLGVAAGLAGWVITGWARPWPVLLPAAIGLQAARTAAAWVVEASCDRRGARTAGTQAMLDALVGLGRVRAEARAARPAWQRAAVSVLTWAAGPPHPPMPLRRAVIRRARQAVGTAAGCDDVAGQPGSGRA